MYPAAWRRLQAQNLRFPIYLSISLSLYIYIYEPHNVIYYDMI